MPPKEQSHTCLKPLKVQAVYLNGSQDWEEQTSTEHTPSQQGIPRLTAGTLSRRAHVSMLTEAAPTSSSLCTEYSCASRARDRPSPRSVISAPLQEPARARDAFSSPGTELAPLERISKTTMRLLRRTSTGGEAFPIERGVPCIHPRDRGPPSSLSDAKRWVSK